MLDIRKLYKDKYVIISSRIYFEQTLRNFKKGPCEIGLLLYMVV